jgi:signal transduction histidine kinase
VTAELPGLDRDRYRVLVDVGIALTSELTLDGVLRRVVDAAAEITGACYAALGVIDRFGHGLDRFVVTGIDDETHAAIGEEPHGRGILGVLIREAKPLRLHDLTEDPRSAGFPPNHPPMKTFLGVPIKLRGVAYGNLYLTEKKGGADFTDEDEELVTLLAAQAAVAIENARLYESSTRWSRQLESLTEVGNALATEIDPERVLQLVAVELREMLGARLVTIALPMPDGALRIDAAAGDDGDVHVGQILSATGSKSARVLERRHSERVDSILEDPEIDQEVARRMGIRTALYVPLVARGNAIGVISAHDKEADDPRFSEDDQRVAELFANRAAIAADVAERVQRDSLRRVVSAQEQERRRLSRELHDETGQALTSILLGLRAVEDAKSQEEVAGRLASVRELAVTTLQDVRRLAVELRPKALDDFGLLPALERLTQTFGDQTGIDVRLTSTLPGKRLPSEVETTLYRIAQEALTNVLKHARASTVSIFLTGQGSTVTAVIEDDGLGFVPGETRDGGLGLIGMRERATLVGGRLALESGDSGTTIVVEIPLRDALSSR